MRRVLTVFRIVLGVVLVAYVIRATGGWEAVARFVEVWWLLPLVSAFPFFAAVLEAVRLRLLAESQEIQISAHGAFALVAVSTLFNFAVPGGTGGDVMKMYYLGIEQRGRLVEVATVLIADRAIALIMLLLVILALAGINFAAVASSSLLQGLVGLAFALLVAATGVVVLSISSRVRRNALYEWLTTRAPLHATVARFTAATRAFAHSGREVTLAMALTALGHVTLAGMFVVLATVLVPDASASLVAFLSLLGMLANAVPITPGGLGVGEAAFEGLYEHMGFAGGALLLLAWRLGVLALAVVGFVYYTAGLRDISERASGDDVSAEK